jgi:hypothetical protein
MFNWFEIKSPLTDLLAVYSGLGVFMANNAIREVNWRSASWSGWSLGRQGYMTMPEYASALALYSLARGEQRPHWARYLRTCEHSSNMILLAYARYAQALLGVVVHRSHEHSVHSSDFRHRFRGGEGFGQARVSG